MQKGIKRHAKRHKEACKRHKEACKKAHRPIKRSTIKADEVANTKEGVMGVVTQFFKQASKQIKHS